MLKDTLSKTIVQTMVGGSTMERHRYDAVVNHTCDDGDHDHEFEDNEEDEHNDTTTNNHDASFMDEPTMAIITANNNVGRRKRRNLTHTNWVIAIISFSLALTISLAVLLYTNHGWNETNNIHTSSDDNDKTTATPTQGIQHKKATVTVRRDLPNFPSFQSFQGQPIHVTYDERAVQLNGKRSLLIGGSMHPSRATRGTWDQALDKAVINGLNLITIYTFWKEHQPSGGDTTMNFTLSEQWELKDALEAAGERGLFIHLRIGPYVCAEYNYGGIPEWVPLSNKTMKMRRYNDPWLQAMKEYVQSMTNYITEHKLWAYQGGPIILGQIENELGSDQQHELEELQKYANWCGDLVQELQPDVVWTMCNGLSASNTINTCNGYGAVSCSKDWIEHYGQSSRIQKEHPALWTEDEGGFQIWGSNASHPSDYFWGQSSQKMALDALHWFARGGSHMNYYMWYGGYNRGSMAAAGITNAYAMDAPLCPNGQEHYPKYLQTQALHHILANLAQDLMEQPSALHQEQPVEVWSYGSNQWVVPTSGTEKQRAFVYNNTAKAGEEVNPIYFVENDSDHLTTIRMPGTSGIETIGLGLKPYSAVIIQNKQVLFDTTHYDPNWTSFTRRRRAIYGSNDDKNTDSSSSSSAKLIWESWSEPIGVTDEESGSNIVFTGNKPIEQNELMVRSNTSTNFAWYEVEFDIDMELKDTILSIKTTQGIAFSVYLDGTYVGSVYDATHGDDSIQLDIKNLGTMKKGTHHVISILSESFGSGNLIGRWKASTAAKQKGLLGDVTLAGVTADSQTKSLNLVPQHDDSSLPSATSSGDTIWKSQSGLNSDGQISSSDSIKISTSKKQQNVIVVPPLTWLRTKFPTPTYIPRNETLLLGITSGRGKLYLNGYDLGMFWNITSDPSNEDYTQKFYELPFDWLVTNRHGSNDPPEKNELVIFSTTKLNTSSIRMALTWLEESSNGNFPDEVSYPQACI